MTNHTVEPSTRAHVTVDYDPSLLGVRERLEHVWRRQVDEVTELTIRLHDMRAGLDQVAVDEAPLIVDLAMIEARLEAARRVLVEYDVALARFAKGTYGFCGHCGESVDTERLASSPAAHLCASCQFWSRRS